MANTATNMANENKKRQILYGNPMELASVVRKQTLVVQNRLYRAGAEENEIIHPLKVYSGFSRFVFAIINEKKESATANIRVTEIPGILAATDYAYRVHMDSLYQPKQQAKKEAGNEELEKILQTPAFTVHIPMAPFTSACPAAYIINAAEPGKAVEEMMSIRDKVGAGKPREAVEAAISLYKEGQFTQELTRAFKTVEPDAPAFTTRITAGKLKGKTPAEVILEAEKPEEAITLLKNQYKWLRDNAKKNAKYAEGNKAQMEAISQAVIFYRDGKLTADAADTISQSVSGKMIPLYTGGFRPLKRRAKMNDKTFVYEAYVSWNVGAQYPVCVEIKNYYATVKEMPDGTLNVLPSTKENEKKNMMALTAEEWMNIVYLIQANMRMFEQLSASACYNDAAKLYQESRERYIAQSTQGGTV